MVVDAGQRCSDRLRYLFLKGWMSTDWPRTDGMGGANDFPIFSLRQSAHIMKVSGT